MMRKFFPKNINSTGRIVRLSIGLLLLIYAYVYASWIALVFALFTFFEALIGWCAFYHMLGRKSCPVSKDKDQNL